MSRKASLSVQKVNSASSLSEADYNTKQSLFLFKGKTIEYQENSLEQNDVKESVKL